MSYDLKQFNIFQYSYFFLLLFFIFSGFSISLSQGALAIAAILLLLGLIKESRSKEIPLSLPPLGLWGKYTHLFSLFRSYIKNIIKTFSLSGIERYIFLFVCVSICLTFLSDSTVKNLEYISDFWLVFAFILAYQLNNSKEDIKRIIYIMIILSLIQSIITLSQNYFQVNLANAFIYGIAHYKARFYSGGFLGMHLVFSGYIIFIALPLVYLCLFNNNKITDLRKRFNYVLLTSVFLIAIAIFLTRTRSILIALPFSVIPLFFIRKRYILLIISVILIMAAIGFIFIFYGQDRITESVNLKGNVFDSKSGNARIKIWETAIRVWLKHPLVGSGGGNYLHEFKQVIKEHPELDIGMITHAHNDYLNQLARKGLVGFFSFIYMLYGIFKYMVVNLKHIKDKLLKGLYLGIFSAYCTFIAASMFQCFYTDEENLAMLWFSVGLLAAIVKVERKNISQ